VAADTNGWNEYQKLVLAEIKRLDVTVKQVQQDVTQIRLHIAVLRTRAVTWGALGGLVMWITSLLAAKYF
jgi:hypothetical protein